MVSMMYQGERRNEGGSALIGMAFMAFSWVLNMFILYLSRLREYYADRHSVTVVDGGSQKLSLGLAKIVNASGRVGRNQKGHQNLNAFKTLFISDPDRAISDAESIAAMRSPNGQDLVRDIISKEPTFGDNLIEAFSTHPNIIKRLRALQALI
jgi:heat shock protein HtpX